MKRLVQILHGLLAGWLALAGVGWPVSADTSEQKLAWFRDAKFGLFLHWGPASLTGKELSWSRMGARPGDIVALQEVPVEVYDNLYKDFNPVKFNAAEWVRIAQDAGMKYLVIITKHHDGFSMFHTKHSEYGIANTPFGRDIVKELADACHRAGLRFGVYYSQRDWYHPEYLKGNNANYTEFLHNQVRELLSNYGKVDIVWFDSFGRSDLVKDWKVYELLDMIHKLQPAALVNNRLAILGDYNKGPRDLWGDYDTPEERIGSFQHGRAWESCMTLVGRQWSYRPGGRMYTREETIRHLVNTATGDGNLLLNVGPTPAGEIEPRQVERLREVGQWLTRYGESIYSTRGGPFRNGKWGGSTYRGKTIYLHVIDWGASRLDLPPLKAKITKWASLTGGKATLVQTAGGIRIIMPVEGRDPVDTILRLDLDGPAMSEIPAGVPLAVPASNPQMGCSIHKEPVMLRTLLLVAAALPAVAQDRPVHVWEKQEITLQAQNSCQNPYTEVDVWVDLSGPNSHKRVYGFWDGGKTFRVRVLATAPGHWSWVSGSNHPDAGLSGKKGAFEAIAWSEAEKLQNECRRGFLRPTANGHAFEYADGTPFFLLGDTWWSTPSYRFRWTDEDTSHAMGPEATFKDMVKFRKRQGFNSVAMIAAFPNWRDDGKPANIVMNDEAKTLIRSAWMDPGTKSAKDQRNEGGQAFEFPGKVPGYEEHFANVDRVNPAYFSYLDKKIDYLNSQGFIPFIETTRRDSGPAWRKFHKWPDSYSRFIQYIFSRYQANNVLLSPIHLDTYSGTIRPHSLYSDAADLVIRKYGAPPFGTLVSTNSSPSSLVNWGHASWLTFHQTGNDQRTHDNYWYMTEMFYARPAMPAIAGEPYYSGYRAKPGETLPYAAEGGTSRDSLYHRSSMYGNFLSGGFGGHIYGAEGIWQANLEPEAQVKMWDAFLWEASAQTKHLRTFAFSGGTRFQDLEPDADLVTPNKTYQTESFEGWAFCARTPQRDFFLVYLEKGLPTQVRVRGAVPDAQYEASWFNPRNGQWANAGSGAVTANTAGRIDLPPRPSEEDWGLRLLLKAAR